MKKKSLSLPPTGQYVVKLKSVGNPDFQQYAPISNPEVVVANSLEKIVQACNRYIEFWNLGGGNWDSPIIYWDNKPVANVSYNLRLWDPTDDKKEILIQQTIQ